LELALKKERDPKQVAILKSEQLVAFKAANAKQVSDEEDVLFEHLLAKDRSYEEKAWIDATYALSDCVGETEWNAAFDTLLKAVLKWTNWELEKNKGRNWLLIADNHLINIQQSLGVITVIDPQNRKRKRVESVCFAYSPGGKRLLQRDPRLTSELRLLQLLKTGLDTFV